MLKDINLSIEKNELVAILGSVGSGKSSLLMSLLGELELINGNIDMKGSVFYLAQEAWIFPTSLKQNILFGKQYDEKKFKEIIEVCCLEEVIHKQQP
jgi:ABC-type transport system involved in cytochrome bd biosynthesis fused ATPase/permease subunit